MFNHSRSAGYADWINKLTKLEPQSLDCVLVTIIQIKGSAPREAGTKMLVLHDDCVGTIGGGHLELKVIERCRELLAGTTGAIQQTIRFPLGASLGQCCGGHVAVLLERLSRSELLWIKTVDRWHCEGIRSLIVTKIEPDQSNGLPETSHSKLLVSEQECVGTLGCAEQDRAAVTKARSLLNAQHQHLEAQLQGNLLFDPLNAAQFHLMLFGAGHVGQAVINTLQALPCTIDWIDSREEIFHSYQSAPNVRVVVSDEPAFEVHSAAPNSYVLVMTHSHQLDLAICEQVLQRPDLAFCGLIGSATKRQRFERQLSARGMPPAALKRLTCPIGIQGTGNKHPAQIAIAVAAQLLQIIEQQPAQMPVALPTPSTIKTTVI